MADLHQHRNRGGIRLGFWKPNLSAKCLNPQQPNLTPPFFFSHLQYKSSISLAPYRSGFPKTGGTSPGSNLSPAVLRRPFMAKKSTRRRLPTQFDIEMVP